MLAHRMLRFKIATSFVIAALGAIMFARLALTVPLTIATCLPFAVAIVFVAAGLWRGYIYLQALRGVAKS